MRSNNLLVYNLQHPHITSNFLMIAIIIMVTTVKVMVVMVVMLAMVVLVNMVVMVVVVNMVVMENRTGQERTKLS